MAIELPTIKSVTYEFSDGRKIVQHEDSYGFLSKTFFLKYQDFILFNRHDCEGTCMYSPKEKRGYKWHEMYDKAIADHGFAYMRNDLAMKNLWLHRALGDDRSTYVDTLMQPCLYGREDGSVYGDVEHFTEDEINQVKEEIRRILETAKTYPQYLTLLH